MRVKSMLIFIVLNIFLMLFSSVMFEYIDLEKRLNNITTVINEAGEAATNVSTASEELFSASYLRLLMVLQQHIVRYIKINIQK